MMQWLVRIYLKIGIHTAPPGTLLFWMHSQVYRVLRPKGARRLKDDTSKRGKFGGIPYYDITRIRETRPVDGLALIFFIGAGDYLMATPFIRALHLAHPDLPIYGYGSSRSDTISSSLIIDLLKINPLIDRVFAYRGRPRTVWRDYDFQDALASVPPGFLILPITYDVEPLVFHRVTTLLEKFNLPVDFPLPRPIAYTTPLSATAMDILQLVRDRSGCFGANGIVCTHFNTRSAGYDYPFVSNVIAQLIERDFLVVNFSPAGLEDKRIIDIDVTAITPADTIELLRALRLGLKKLFVISVNSLMWPISAALDIPNLGLHIFEDPSMHQYLYPNIFVATPFFYDTLPPFRLFLAQPNSFQMRRSVDGVVEFVDYKPGYVLDTFETMISLIKN